MEMSYAGALVLPKGCAFVSADEMEYIEGGYYISNRTLVSACKAVGLASMFSPAGAIAAGIVISTAVSAIRAAGAALGARLGAFAGPVGTVVGGILGIGIAGVTGSTVAEALFARKGINISVKHTSGGMPYGVEVSVQ